MNMASSTQFAPSRNMAICDPVHQITMWEDAIFRSTTHITPNNNAAAAVMQSEYASHESSIPVDNQGDNRGNIPEKAQRRLAQNREAARKSRMRKKAYVQQLEVSRLKLAQLELELERAKQQHACIGGVGGSFGSNRMLNPGTVTFEIEYGHWIEEQEAKTSELRNVLQSGGINDVELHVVVENVLNHYHDLFRMKSEAVKADVFYLVSGVWRTSVERFFFWIGGFRPSELVKVVMPHLQPLTDQQVLDVCNLRHSCQQAEDALSQGIDKLQQNLAQSIAVDITGLGNYSSYMAAYIEQLEALETFVNQADHLRQQTLQQMSRILSTRQTARGLLACGEYFQRLRALSSLWAARPREMA